MPRTFRKVNLITVLTKNPMKRRQSDVAERLRAPNSNSGVSNQQSVGSNPQA